MGVLELVEQSEATVSVPVVETMGATAYGDGGTPRTSPTRDGSW